MSVLATIRKQDLYLSTLPGVLKPVSSCKIYFLEVFQLTNYVQENGRRCVVVPKAAASKESRYFETNEAVEIIIEREKRSAV